MGERTRVGQLKEEVAEIVGEFDHLDGSGTKRHGVPRRIVSLFEETIASNTALGVLLPVVAGQSGNLGSQALAVVIRALALREIRVRQWLQVCPRS